MTEYLVCPERKGKKVDISVCLQTCELHLGCEKFKAVDRSILELACKRLRISLSHLKEIEPVIDVEVIPEVPEFVPETTEPFQESPEAVAIVEANVQEANKLYDQAIEYKQRIEGSFWELGITLQKLFLTRYYFGYSTWPEFIENDPLFQSLDLRLRNTDYLRSIPEKFGEMGISREECIEVGKSKLIALLPIVDKKNCRAWLKEAKGLTHRELLEKIREATGKGDKSEKETGEHTEPWTVHLYPPQKETIERAMKICETMAESDKRGHLLETIGIEFISSYPEESGRLTFLKRIIERLESMMAISIECTDLKTGEIMERL